ncbi:MAG: SAM-dependent methyltransferase, partial [Bryobacteraceae bacterium]
MNLATMEPAASFRDPAGSLVCIDGRMYRFVRREGADDLHAFLQSSVGQDMVKSGFVVDTSIVPPERLREVVASPALQKLSSELNPELVCEHERISFPSYPYEWCPEMLYRAGLLTLDLARRLLPEGLGLKDATPYNVLFRGPDAVFVDVLSFERRDAHDPIWLPHAQFVRSFVLPLLANKYYGVPLSDIFFMRRDGLEHEEVYRWTKIHQRFRPPFLSMVSLPAWFGRGRTKESIYQPKRVSNAEKARFIVESLLARLTRVMRKLEPAAASESKWSDYTVCNNNYSSEQADRKQAFVAEALKKLTPGRVLDIGCNTGQFSRLAAAGGAFVVAIDY